MRIKKHQNKNQYICTPQNMWVRNFTLQNVPYIDLNETIKKDDYPIFLNNEIQNSFKKYPWIHTEKFLHSDAIIVSDGFKFSENHKILAKLPKSVSIIGVNGALSKWENANRNINYYVVNNPYKECMRFLPRNKRILPTCIASQRTNYQFLEYYNGIKFRYYPVNEKTYSTKGMKETQWQIDDYRNPICAAIGLAFRFGVQKLLLLNCDDVFETERPGANMIENGMWIYPQHEVAHGLIDANLYWLKSQDYMDVIIGNCSSGPKFTNALNIEANKILEFFGVTNNEQKD